MNKMTAEQLLDTNLVSEKKSKSWNFGE